MHIDIDYLCTYIYIVYLDVLFEYHQDLIAERRSNVSFETISNSVDWWICV